MKFKSKKSILMLSVSIFAISLTGCFNNKKDEYTSNAPQQEQQINNNQTQEDNNKEENNNTQEQGNTQQENNTQQEGNKEQTENNKQESNKDKETNNKVENNKDKETNKETNNKVENNKDKANNKDKQNTQTDNTITENKALQLCKQKLVGIWAPDFLTLGTNKSGINRIVKVGNKEYYAIYHIDKKENIVADFRFLVEKSSGKIFYQSPEDLNKLVSIDDYIAKFKKYDSDVSNNNENKFTPKKAIELTLKYINKSAEEKGDTFAAADKFSIMLRHSDNPMVKNNKSYYPIEFYVPNEEGRYSLCGQWYINNEGKLYHSNGSLGTSINDISTNLVDKNKIWK